MTAVEAIELIQKKWEQLLDKREKNFNHKVDIDELFKEYLAGLKEGLNNEQ